MMPRLFLVLALSLLVLGATSGAVAQDGSGQSTWSFSGPTAEDGSWEMRVTASRRSCMPGDGLTLAIDFTINSLGLAWNIDRTNGVYTLITGARTFDGSGDMVGGSHAMASTILTGVGLPIEGESHGLPTDRFGGPFHHPIDSFVVTAPMELEVDVDAGIIRGTAVHGILLEPDVPTGWYRLRIDIGLEILNDEIVSLWGVDSTLPTTRTDRQTYAVTGPIAVGTDAQPRMIWTLFSGSLSNGGVVAVEDRGYVAASRGTGYSSRAVLPMTAADGTQVRYLLEPDFPLVWNPFMREGMSPIELDYQAGWMEARIENPDGTIVDLGGGPFAGRRGMGATTLQDRFAYSFSSYGKHHIELTGWIKDASGQAYTGGGVYEVYVARPLEIRPNVLPGTPFREHEFFDVGFQLYPPVPAEVEVKWELDGHSNGSVESGRFEAKANRWGYYSPPVVERRSRFGRPTRVRFGDPGEYKVTYRGSYEERDGTLWLGEKVAMGVVIPGDAIPLSSRASNLPGGGTPGAFAVTLNARYLPAPPDTGDCMMVPVSPQAGLPTVYTFPMGLLLAGTEGFRTDDTALLELPGTVGTFVAPRLATSNGLFPRNYPEAIDRRAYLITSTVRTDGFEMSRVEEGCPSANLPYPTYPWRPSELAVEAIGDIYHFWSAMVYRDTTENRTRYGYYSAGAAATDETDVPRLHAEGEPLVSDGWGSHALVLHNVAVEPGAIVSRDTPFTPGGYYLPLPKESTVEFIVTPPMGDQHIITLSGDERGYACDMGARFDLEQSGVWKVEARLIQGEETGGVLGAEPGEPWEFYVIDGANNEPVLFHLPSEAALDPDSDLVILTGDLMEADITQGTVHVSATYNGAVLEQTTRTIQNEAFVYSIDLSQIPYSFPSYDPEDPYDRVVISFFIEGLSSRGERRLAARRVYVQRGTIYTGEKEYRGINPLTREERARELREMVESELAHGVRGRVPGEDGEAE